MNHFKNSRFSALMALVLVLAMVLSWMPAGVSAAANVEYIAQKNLTNAEARNGSYFVKSGESYLPITVTSAGSTVYRGEDGKDYTANQVSTKWTDRNGVTRKSVSPYVTSTLKTYTRAHSSFIGINRFWYVNDKNSKDTTATAYSAANARKNFKSAKEFYNDGATGNIKTDDKFYVAAVYTAIVKETSSVVYTYTAGGKIVATGSGADSLAPVTLYVQRTIEEHVHSYTSTVVPASCENGGFTIYSCACGDSYTADITSALGHSYSDTVVAPTTEADGYTLHTCVRCGASYKDTPTHKHNLKETIVKPTCTEGGYTVRSCTRCDFSETVNPTKAKGHSYKDTVVPPTTKTEGYTEHTCTVCGDSYSDSFVEPLKVSGTFTIASMNVDGLPNKILGISINGDGPGADGTKKISQAIAQRDWDFFAVSEDFNYHSELMSALSSRYNAGKHRGGVNWITNNTDGLDLIWKNTMKASNETFVAWQKNYSTGIFGTGNGADTMIKKGFRLYTMTVAEDVDVDVYILHMDADSDQGDIDAREAQLKQLVSYIKNRNSKNPIIVMGDTNCRYTREQLKVLFIDAMNDGRYSAVDPWVELAWGGKFPTYGADSIMAVDKGGPFPYPQAEIVDKMFVINNTASNVTLTVNSYTVDTSFVSASGAPLADHWPIVANIGYTAK